MIACSIDGCDRPSKSRGWCNTHHERWRRHGDPNVVLRTGRKVVFTEPRWCSIEGCGKPLAIRGWCAMHHWRWKTHGDPLLLPERQLSENGFPTSDGYTRWYLPRHPIAGRSGEVRVHRVRLWESIGPGEHPCTWCGRTVSWGLIWPRDGVGALVVDHLDGDPSNNHLSNLTASCQPCNSVRLVNK